FRLAALAREEFERAGMECDFLDLSLLTAQYGRQILPCKACVSTAMPLCHWPCSCYPNHAMGQVNDWMHELYPRWVAAHGVLIVTPVYWYQAPSVLKLMIDRLVCADGGNPDPTTTRGKGVKEAKELELAGWSYPRHLAGRVFAVHNDGEHAAGEVTRIAPSGELEFFRFFHTLPARRRRIRIAAVGADEAIDHQLQHARRLIPVHGRNDQHAVRRNPARIQLVHPVIHLAHGVIRIARARPVTERHRRGYARLARENL